MQTDVLIIGAGGAGLCAAIAAKEAGAKVIVTTKEYPTRSQTCMAQGGINAVLRLDDSIENHIADTLEAAKGLSNKEAVRLLCQSAPEAISWLNHIGVPFSRTNDTKIAQRRLGGASHPRACYAQDYTGLKILHTLFDYANKLDVEFISERFLLDLIVKEGVCKGALFLNVKTGEIEPFIAKSVVLATGGYSKLYQKHSTNSKTASGDGIAVAARAGAELKNMEFVQFHPTALENSSILISESARGAGGKIYNTKKERFIDELKPRDEVSLAIYEEMKKGERIYLDITHLGEAFIDKELPQERKLALLYAGIDPAKEPIPIKPAAHYTMGGVKTNINTQTNVTNLFAVGECSEAGLHGANRLGGNSLLEIVVFGKIAGKNAANVKSTDKTDLQTDITNAKLKLDKLFAKEIKHNFYETKAKLGDLFYNYCGIVRSKEGLESLLAFVEQTQNNLHLFGIVDKSKNYNTNLVDYLEFENLLQIAHFVAKAALKNEKSIGAHKRGDV